MSKTARLAYLLAGMAALMPPRARAQETPPEEPLEGRRTQCIRSLDGDCLIAIADFEAAAEAFARFSVEHRDDPRAPAMLARAANLWRELGQFERVLDVAREFRRRYPAHRALAGVAEEVFLLSAPYRERRQPEREAASYDLYLKEWAGVGGIDRAVVAHVRLAAFLLAESCPVAGVRGTCIEIARVSFKCSELGGFAVGLEKQPTNLTSEIAIRHRRDPALVGKADQHLRQAKRLLAKMKPESPDLQLTIGLARRNDLADASADSILLGVHSARDEYLALRRFPSAVSYDGPTPWDSPAVAARKRWMLEESQRRWMDWMRTKTRLLKPLQTAARDAMAKLGPTSMARAAGLFAEVTDSLRLALTDSEDHLLECRPDGFYHEGGGWVLDENANTAMTACLAIADAIPVDDEWSAFCQPRSVVKHYSYFSHVTRPAFPQTRNEQLPGLLCDEATTALDGPASKPNRNPPTEMRQEIFPLRPFPGIAGAAPPGILRLPDGKEIAWAFERLPAFDVTILDKLAVHAGPFPAPNRASLLRLSILGARRECYYPLPVTLVVETARNRIVTLDSPEGRTNIDCLEKAAKTLVLPETYFKDEHARWMIDL